MACGGRPPGIRRQPALSFPPRASPPDRPLVPCPLPDLTLLDDRAPGSPYTARLAFRLRLPLPAFFPHGRGARDGPLAGDPLVNHDLVLGLKCRLCGKL